MVNRVDRREFLKRAGIVVAGSMLAGGELAGASEGHEPSDSTLGVLVDTTLCIGCRKCELACERKNSLTRKPDKFFEDTSVLNRKRPLSIESYTIVNKYRYQNAPKPTFIKTQCMHCNYPACVSACIVGALTKDKKTGAVLYDYDKCIGCRYCMVACPHQVPKYEFSEPLKPRVMKCNFCGDLLARGGTPACVDACPVSCLVFGKRNTLVKLGHKWIDKNPRRYANHIYGEHEVGGSSWMYLAGGSFETLGLSPVGDKAPPELSEKLQHSVFKHWIPPVSLYLILGGAMWLFKRKDEAAASDGGDQHSGENKD